MRSSHGLAKEVSSVGILVWEKSVFGYSMPATYYLKCSTFGHLNAFPKNYWIKSRSKCVQGR